jgi:hypothetical protein
MARTAVSPQSAAGPARRAGGPLLRMGPFSWTLADLLTTRTASIASRGWPGELLRAGWEKFSKTCPGLQRAGWVARDSNAQRFLAPAQHTVAMRARLGNAAAFRVSGR